MVISKLIQIALLSIYLSNSLVILMYNFYRFVHICIFNILSLYPSKKLSKNNLDVCVRGKVHQNDVGSDHIHGKLYLHRTLH